MAKVKPPINQTPGVFTDTIRGTTIELNYKDLTEDVYNVLRGKLDGRRNTSGNGAELKDAGFLSVFEGDLGKGYVSLTTNAHYQSDIIQKIVAGLNEYLVKRYGRYDKDGTLTNAANIPAFTVARPNLRTVSAAMDNHAKASVNKSLVKMPVARDYHDGIYTAMYRTKTGSRGKALDQDVYERVSDAVLAEDERIAASQERQYDLSEKRVEARKKKDEKEAQRNRKFAEKVFSDARKEVRREQNVHNRELRKTYRPGITMLAGDVAEGLSSFEDVADYLATVPGDIREEMRELFNRTFASRKHTKDKAQWKKENDPSKRQKAMITMLAGDVAEGLKTRGNVEDYLESLPENVQGEMRELFEKKYDVLKGKRDRLIRANIRAEERDPANPRFYTHIGEGLDRQEARYRARVAWAKQNPETRLGKQILKADRAVRFRGAKGKALLIASLLAVAVKTLGTILSAVLRVGDLVNKTSLQAVRYNMQAPEVAEFTAQAAALGFKDTEVYSKVFGKLSMMLSNKQEPSGLNSILTAVASMSALTSGKTIDETVNLYLRNTRNPVALYRAGINEAMTLLMQDKDNSGVTVAGGYQNALPSFLKMFDQTGVGEWGDLLTRYAEGYFKIANPTQRAEIEKRTKAGENWDTAITSVLYGGDKTKAAAAIVDPSTRGAANEAQEEWAKLAGDTKTIWDGILAILLSGTQFFKVAAEGLVRWVASIPAARKLFPQLNEVLRSSYQADDEANRSALTENTNRMQADAAIIQRLGGMTVEEMASAVSTYHRSGGAALPAGVKSDDEWAILMSFYQDYLFGVKKEKELNEQIERYITEGEAHKVADLGPSRRNSIVQRAVYDYFMGVVDEADSIRGSVRSDKPYQAQLKELDQKIVQEAKMSLPGYAEKSDAEIMTVLTGATDDEALKARGITFGTVLYNAIKNRAYLLDRKDTYGTVEGKYVPEGYYGSLSKRAAEFYGVNIPGLSAAVAEGLGAYLTLPDTVIKVETGKNQTDLYFEINAADGRKFNYELSNLPNGSTTRIDRSGASTSGGISDEDVKNWMYQNKPQRGVR